MNKLMFIKIQDPLLMLGQNVRYKMIYIQYNRASEM